MNQRREDHIEARDCLEGALALLAGIARAPESQARHERIIEARMALKRADHAFRRLARKPATSCEVQGCFEVATRRHTMEVFKNQTEANPYGRTTVKLCERHSATSRLPEQPKEKKP